MANLLLKPSVQTRVDRGMITYGGPTITYIDEVVNPANLVYCGGTRRLIDGFGTAALRGNSETDYSFSGPDLEDVGADIDQPIKAIYNQLDGSISLTFLGGDNIRPVLKRDGGGIAYAYFSDINHALQATDVGLAALPASAAFVFQPDSDGIIGGWMKDANERMQLARTGGNAQMQIDGGARDFAGHAMALGQLQFAAITRVSDNLMRIYGTTGAQTAEQTGSAAFSGGGSYRYSIGDADSVGGACFTGRVYALVAAETDLGPDMISIRNALATIFPIA